MKISRALFPFLLLTFTSVLSQSAEDPCVARMDQVAQESVKNHQFSGSVLVARDAAVIFDKGYGSANLEWNIPNAPDTKFRIGSITKQFTAAAILLLQERGKLSISDPVKKLMPDAPAAWEKITLFHLLTHTSGIPDFTEFPDFPASEAKASTPAELVARFRDKPLDFPPGTKFQYSNSGYVLLGALLEKASGQPYCDFVQANIFTPLAMKDSGCDSNAKIIARRAAGYEPAEHGVENTSFIHMSIPFSAGSLLSTTEDLLRWERGLFGGKLLRAASLQQMTTPYREEYGLGVFVRTQNGRTVVEHNGGIEGFNAKLAYFPADKLTLIALGNLSGRGPENLEAQLARVAHGEPVTLMSERKEIVVAPNLLARDTGTYQLSPTFALTITLENGHLVEQATGQSKLPLFAQSPTFFFLKDVDAQIEFFPDNTGRSAYLVLHQNGRDRRADRK